jgi:hypothetical protein
MTCYLFAMAKQTFTRLIDDLDGSPATKTAKLELDGRLFTVDLNDKHDTDLRTKLAPFIDAARPLHANNGAPLRASNPVDSAAIRQWALDEGIELPSRGRIAGAVKVAYDARDPDALYEAVGLERD